MLAASRAPVLAKIPAAGPHALEATVEAPVLSLQPAALLERKVGGPGEGLGVGLPLLNSFGVLLCDMHSIETYFHMLLIYATIQGIKAFLAVVDFWH